MEKKYKNGLTLGKYMPLHYGHMYLINTAAKGCDKLTVLACSIKSEPIPGPSAIPMTKCTLML